MRFSKLGLCAVFTLLSVPLAADIASACPTLFRTDHGTSIVSSGVVSTDCFFRPSASAMRIYEKVETVYQEYVIENWRQCDGSIVRVRKNARETTSSFCWQPTNTACVGNQDWPPTPLCF